MLLSISKQSTSLTNGHKAQLHQSPLQSKSSTKEKQTRQINDYIKKMLMFHLTSTRSRRLTGQHISAGEREKRKIIEINIMNTDLFPTNANKSQPITDLCVCMCLFVRLYVCLCVWHVCRIRYRRSDSLQDQSHPIGNAEPLESDAVVADLGQLNEGASPGD